MNRPNCRSAHGQLDRPSTILRLAPTSARDSLSSRRPPMTRQISDSYSLWLPGTFGLKMEKY
ncbi:conserved hypothetical protein [Coccidioides posadasii str. Silveira]|uniref:Uncharacterized protein n=2 Tax=Coccidioides posadasii TaxID=199306 RepID=E9DHR6_COCPS|nr:conserved hypothetical protein [Coccidioides posadasii str. Silveira]KMM69472.1 hypothetical protein CPAG_05787 [Coccidioides posadasii RMSCC 3488]